MWRSKSTPFGFQEPAPKKRPALTVESASDDEDESPPVPLKRRKLKKDAPAPEPRPMIRIKVAGRRPRPPPVIIEEPTEEELNVLLSKPVESDNSSPGAEIPLQVAPPTIFNLCVDDHVRLCIFLNQKILPLLFSGDHRKFNTKNFRDTRLC